MNTAVCVELFHHICGVLEVEIGPSPKEAIGWVKSAKIPWGLSQLLHFDWPQESFDLDKFRVYSAQEISEDALRPPLLGQGFLVIGYAINGDPLVVRLMGEECEIGMISHESMDMGEADVTSLYEPIARSLESFLHKILQNKYLPTDYFAAKAYNQFLAEEKQADSG